MSDSPDGAQIVALRQRIARLEVELAQARTALHRLETVEGIPPDLRPRVPESGDEKHRLSAVTAESPSEEKLALFRHRFAGRDDVYALTWTSRRTGKSGWSPAVRGGFYSDDVTDADLLPLTNAVLERHLTGRQDFHVGLYPMLTDDRCRLLVCDFDDAGWRADAAAYVEECARSGIDTLAEISRSGSGAHVWMFFASPVPAVAARSVGASLLRAAMARRPTMDFRSYDRFFPAQDTLPQRSSGRARLGNLIALPLQGDCRRRATTVFADPRSWVPHEDQFAALAAIAPVDPGRLAEIAAAPTPIGPRQSLGVRSRRATIKAATKGAAGSEVVLRCDAMVHVPFAGLSGLMINELKHLASVANPEFYRKQAQRLSTFGTPRLVTCFERDGTELRLPRGLLDEAALLLTDSGYRVVRSSRPAPAGRIDVTFTGELRPEQLQAVDALLAHDTGVLVAPPGSGKTVIACALIAERAVPTAILVNRAELLAQWRERLQQFLSLTDKQIGQLGAGRRKRRGVVDLVMMQSVSHRNADPSLLQEYGQVIVDECHAVAAPATEAALRRIDVACWTGLTATPYRADQMDGLITMQCGPIRHRISVEDDIERQLIVHPTGFTTAEDGVDGASIQAMYTELATDTRRNAQIVTLVVDAANSGRACLVLTNRRDQLGAIVAQLRDRTQAQVLELHGGLSAADRREVRERLSAADEQRDPFVLVAIDKVAGEGLDLPTLNTLFLAVPVSFKGRVIQQVGRITRGLGGNGIPAVVHDFHDADVPLFDRMYRRRRRVMATAGFAEAPDG